jgi:D-alanyl-D-alanine carboxypeptidase
MNLKWFIFILISGLSSCARETINFPTTDCYWSNISINHIKNSIYQDLIETYSSKGFPGINLLIDRSGEDLWVGSSGVSRIENQQALEPCNIMPAGGSGKLFCGAAVMMMVEDGLLELDNTIDKYLPTDIAARVPNGGSATIANLLSHTSGIPDYYENINAMLDLLNNKDIDFSRERMLEDYVYGKSPKFNPGDEYSYSNSNYEILTLIMDQVYPKGHIAYYDWRILARLGLRKTFYKSDTTYINLYERGMANGYFDRHGDGVLENATDLSLTIASGQTGSDGVVSNVVDIHTLLKSIMEADLISTGSMNLMKEYIKEKEGFQTYKYGLGLVYRDYGQYGMAIGYPGSSPGFATEAWYFPDKDTYVVYQVNAGNFLSGPVQRLIDEEFRAELLATIFGI